MREDKIIGAAAATEFSFTLARVAVGQTCQSTGNKGAKRPALEDLTDIATRYLKAVAKLSAESANSNGRTESNLFDIIAAIEELASIQGFDGAWRVRPPSLWNSAVIKDLMKLVKYQTPFAQPLPPRRSCSDREEIAEKLRKKSRSGASVCSKYVDQPMADAVERADDDSKAKYTKIFGTLSTQNLERSERDMAVESSDHIYALPEDCIATALSLTSPKDACRLSAVASTFRSASESDAVWGRFLPSDYPDIISRAVDGGDSLLAKFNSKKDLYLHLCDHPIVIDDGRKSFQLEKMSGSPRWQSSLTFAGST